MNETPPLCDGRYRLVRVLGLGGMATVYLAHDTRLGVLRAIKVLSPQLTRSKLIRRRFLSEAQTMARLHHPNIVTVHDVGVDGDRVFMVMELLEGGNLADHIKARGPLSPGQAIEITKKVLSTLEMAHEQQVVHRDIKPANVLIGRDAVPKLTDFGIALVSDRASLTAVGATLGTFGYMAPEQRADASKVDPRADLYALSATLFTLMTGREPVDLHASEQHARAFAGMPEDVAEFIARGTSFNPDKRWATAAEMAASLAELSGRYPPAPLIPLPFPMDDVLPGLDLDDVESDILPEIAPPKADLRQRPATREAPPVQRPTTASDPPPPWRDFAAGMALPMLLAAVGWLVWSAFLSPG